MVQYTIGIDMGSLSGRAVLADVADGREVASAQADYPHGCIDGKTPWGDSLPEGFALQHPDDFLYVLEKVLPQVARAAAPGRIIGVGLDCTASTVLPVDEAGAPLCRKDQYRRNPYAYVWMWKHHAAHGQAKRMMEVALERQEPWLPYYGGGVDPEWLAPKLLQLYDEAPSVYRDMAHYVEVSEWLTWLLTGRYTRSKACMSYKAFFQDAFPSRSYLEAVRPGFGGAMEAKLSGPILKIGEMAGRLTREAAEKYGLPAGIPVAVGCIDAHASIPAAGIDTENKLLSIVGTSTCHMVMDRRMLPIPGISGAVMDGVTPGFATYEAGQCCVGDHFRWFADRCVPAYICQETERRGLPVQAYLTELASRMLPGQSGLMCLDWWNGNRSVLRDVNLSGLMLGMTLATRPEELYRALLEATAYGARVIVDNYERHGVKINSVYMTGGVAQKNALAMQIYADVLNRPLYAVDTFQGPALGCAIFAATACGAYSGVAQATRAMGGRVRLAYRPDPDGARVYERLYNEYTTLYDYFGRGGNDVMKRLKTRG